MATSHRLADADFLFIRSIQRPKLGEVHYAYQKTAG